MMKKQIFIILLAITSIFVNLSFGAFPEKPITIVVHSKPGSGIDVSARKLAQLAKNHTDVPILVENRSGGSGMVAMREVLSRKADGYTVMAVTKSFISTALLTNSEVSMDDFTFFACMVVDPEALITNKNAEITTFEQILADAKAKDGHQKWVGPFVGGLDHLMAIKTWETLKISADWIPYDSGSDAIVAIMGKHGVVYVGNPRDTKGRPDLMMAAIAAPERLEPYPDVPTFKELGYLQLEDEVLWRGFAVKGGMNPEALAYLEDLFFKLSQEPEWIEFVESTGANAVFKGTQEYTKIVKNDKVQAVKYLQLAGIMAEKKIESKHVIIVGLIIVAIMLLLIFLIRLKTHQANGNINLSLIFMAFASFFYYLTLSFPKGKIVKTIGPSSVPRLWIYLLIIFCIILIVQALRGKVRSDKKQGQTFLVLKLIALLIGYLVVIKFLGYFISTFLFLMATIWLMNYRKYKIILLIVTVFLVFIYIAFYKVLHVPLPMGVWG